MNLCACGQLFNSQQDLVVHLETTLHQQRVDGARSDDPLAPYKDKKVGEALALLGFIRKPARGHCDHCGEFMLGGDAAIAQGANVFMHVSCALALGVMAMEKKYDELHWHEAGTSYKSEPDVAP